jgi:hypothetical protein
MFPQNNFLSAADIVKASAFNPRIDGQMVADLHIGGGGAVEAVMRSLLNPIVGVVDECLNSVRVKLGPFYQYQYLLDVWSNINTSWMCGPIPMLLGCVVQYQHLLVVWSNTNTSWMCWSNINTSWLCGPIPTPLGCAVQYQYLLDVWSNTSWTFDLNNSLHHVLCHTQL